MSVDKRMVFLLLAILLIIMSLFSTLMLNKYKQPIWNGNIEYTSAFSWVDYDISDVKEVVNHSDIVFVGKVKAVTTIDSEEVSSYKVIVERVLKGKVPTEVICKKVGGISKDGTKILLRMTTGELKLDNTGYIFSYDRDIPQVEHTYIFTGRMSADGAIYLSEMFDNREYTNLLLSEYEGYLHLS